MAIDPATAKIIAQIALKMATDSETRKKMLIIILAPALTLLLITTMFFYILTHPIEYLQQYFSDKYIVAVEQLQNEFGMYQGIPKTENDYTENFGKTYEPDVINIADQAR